MTARKGDAQMFYFIVGAVILILGVVVFVKLQQNVGQSGQCSTNVNAIRTWVLISAGKERSPTTTAGANKPPVPDLDCKIELKNEQQLKTAHKQLADAMYNCWSAFDRGETNFMQAIAPAKRFCYPCVPVMIDNSLKHKGYKVEGLNQFLATTRVRSDVNAPTYLEYLTNRKGVEPGVQDEFEINDDLFVFFVANAGRDWKDVGKLVLGIEDAAGDDASVESAVRTAAAVQVGKKVLLRGVLKFVPGLGAVVTVGEIVIVGEKVIFGNRPFNAFIVIDEPEAIRKICSEDTTPVGVA